MGLSKGAKAGIGVGSVVGVVIIAFAAFLRGARMRRNPRIVAQQVSGSEGGPPEFKAELDGGPRPVAELDSREIVDGSRHGFR